MQIWLKANLPSIVFVAGDRKNEDSLPFRDYFIRNKVKNGGVRLSAYLCLFK